MAETVISETVEITESTGENTDLGDEHSETPSNLQASLVQTSTTDHDNDLAPIADSEAPQVKTKKIIRRKKRPARPQVDPSTIKSEPPPQTGTIFNIWYVFALFQNLSANTR